MRFIAGLTNFRLHFVKKRCLLKFIQLTPRNTVFKRSISSDVQLWDVVVSGGGLVGCAMACALGSSKVLTQKKILLIEENKETNYSIDENRYSNRVSAISPGSRTFFKGIGAWDEMKSLRVKDVKKLQVWESCSDARIGFSAPELVQTIAYIIENDVILRALYSRLKNLKDKVSIMRGVQVVDYKLPQPRQLGDENVSFSLNNGVTLKTKLLIGADGVNSLVRKTMGVKYLNWKYNQMGIVGTLRLAEQTSNIVAWQRFLPSGPIALLPLTDDLCSLVWTVSDSFAKTLKEMSDEEFIDVLNSSLWSNESRNSIANDLVLRFRTMAGNVLGGQTNVQQLPPSVLSVEPKSRAAFPLGLGHAVEYVGHKVAIIGDAAHRVHPLAGQGVNLGFGDVQCLTTCLETSVYNGNDIGAIEPLLDYEAQRQRHVVPSMVAIDLLQRLYCTEFTPVVVLRSLGLTLVDSMASLKNQIIKHASS